MRPALVFLPILLLYAGSLMASELAGIGRLQLELQEALRWNNAGHEERHAILLDLIWDGRQDGPRPVNWAFAETYNDREHEVTIREWTATDHGVSAVIQATIGRDPWTIPGGNALWEVRLSRTDAGWTGTYKGISIGKQVAGQATGTWRAGPCFAKLPGHQEIQPNEHPRLLIRKSELPGLRAVAESEQGQAFLREFRQTVHYWDNYDGWGYITGKVGAGYAFLYLMEQQQEDLERATELCNKAMASNPAKGEVAGFRDYYHGVIQCYDMLYPAWDAEQRLAVATWMDRMSKLYADLAKPIRQARVPLIKGRFVHSNSFMTYRAMAGLMALACYKDTVAYPSPPPPTEVHALQPLSIDTIPLQEAYSEHLQVGHGQTTSVAKALIWGPHATDGRQVHLPTELLKGYAAIENTGGAWDFEPLSESVTMKASGQQAISARKAVPSGTEAVFFSVLQVPDDITVKVSLDHANTDLYICGQQVESGSYLRLATGSYPMLFTCIGRHPPGKGRFRLGPVFRAVQDPQLIQADWERQRNQWLEAGQINLRVERDLAIFARHTRRFLSSSMGSKGNFASQSSLDPLHHELPLYLLAERNVRGVDLTHGTGFDQAGITGLLRGEANVWRWADRGGAGICLDRMYFLSDPQWQPQLAWAIDQVGIWPKRCLNPAMDASLPRHLESSPLLAFKYLAQRVTVGDVEQLPRVWHDDKLGSTIFCRSIIPGEDVSLYVTREAVPERPWLPSRNRPHYPHRFTGNFELYGLGGWFARRDDHRQHTLPIYCERWTKNVPDIRLPIDDFDDLPKTVRDNYNRKNRPHAFELVPAKPAAQTAFEQHEDGSAVISLEVRDWTLGIFGVWSLADLAREASLDLCWKRTIGVTFPQDPEVKAIVAIADTFTGRDADKPQITWLMQPAPGDWHLEQDVLSITPTTRNAAGKPQALGRVLWPTAPSLEPGNLLDPEAAEARITLTGEQNTYVLVFAIGTNGVSAPTVVTRDEEKSVVACGDVRVTWADGTFSFDSGRSSPAMTSTPQE